MRNLFLKTILLTYVFICTINVNATDFNDVINNVIPKIGASPEVAMLGKFDYASVSNYTGVPNISIPLYSIKENGIDIPIVLQYNSSGIKVGEEATWVGLGWNLSVGGSITQIPVGEPDQSDFFSNFFTYSNYTIQDYINAPDVRINGYMYSYTQPKGLLFQYCVPAPPTDKPFTFGLLNSTCKFQLGQPDLYTFSILDNSGKFYVDLETKEPKQFGNIKEKIFFNGNNPIKNGAEGWLIRDMNGIRYSFIDKEITNSETLIPGRYNNQNLESQTWKISSITYPSGQKIQFSYTDGKVLTYNTNETYNGSSYYPHPQHGISRITSKSISNTKYLNSIETDNQRIEFVLSSNKDERQDLDGEIINSVYSAKRLNAINVWDKLTNKKIMSYRFNYDYFNNSNTNALENKRLKLLSITKIAYNNGELSDSINNYYSFEYNETYPLPGKHSNAQDWWGYYNGKTSNTGLLPKLSQEVLNSIYENENLIFNDDMLLAFFNKGDANRGCDTTFVTSGLLSKITYPTKGYCKLQYQSNDFSNYSILSANDIDNGTTFQRINMSDYRMCGQSHPPIVTLTPPDGHLKLYDIKLGISRIDKTIDWHTFSSIYVSVTKVSADGTATKIKEWRMSSQDIDLMINNNESYYSFNTTSFDYQGLSTDKYVIVASVWDLITNCSPSYPLYAAVNFECYYRNPATGYQPKAVSQGGGVRISSETLYDNDNKLLQNRRYSYNNIDGITSGKLMSPLKFYSYRNIVNKWEIIDPNTLESQRYQNNYAYLFYISQNSYFPISYDACGSLVGYDRVTIQDLGISNNSVNGSTIYYYNNTPCLSSGMDGVPLIPYGNNGLENKIEYYDINNTLIKKESMAYQLVKDSTYVSSVVYDNYIGPDKCDGASIAISNPFAYEGRWGVMYYPLRTDCYKLMNSTESELRDGSFVENKNYFSYNELGQLTSVIQELNGSNKIEKKYKYLFDAADNDDPIYPVMKQKTLYNSLLDEKIVKNSNVLVDELKYTYDYCTSGNVKPISVQKVTPTNVYDRTSNILYDKEDNIQSYKQYNEPNAFIIWGYGYQYPIIVVKGATNTEVESAVKTIFSVSSVDALSVLLNPNESKLSDGSLQKTLSNAQVITYTYKPLIGMTSMTDQRGITTAYNYDIFNRLGETRDRTGNIVAKYQYAYSNQTNSGSSMSTQPSFTAAMSCNTSVQTGTNESIFVSINGGSGFFVYSWKITDVNNVTIVNIEDTNLSSYSYTYLNDGTYTVLCTVKDIASGNTQIVTKNVISSSITASMSFYTSNLINTSNLVMVAASGGSNSFTYSYEIKNSSGTIVKSNYNSTSSSFLFTLITSGNYTVYCTIKDNTTGSTKTISKQLYICNSALSVSITGTTSYSKGSTGSLLANISGGSGSFTYLWTKSNNYINLNTCSMPPVSFICGSTSGTTVLTFTLTDARTGKTVTTTKTITIQ